MADAKLYSNLYGSATILPKPNLDYATLQASIAGAANAADYKDALLRVRDSSPCVLAMVDRDHPAMIVISHAPRVFRATPGTIHPSNWPGRRPSGKRPNHPWTHGVARHCIRPDWPDADRQCRCSSGSRRSSQPFRLHQIGRPEREELNGRL